MKKIFSHISLCMAIVMIFTMFKYDFVNADTIASDNWITACLSDYEPLQSLLEEYPDAKLVQTSTTYILNKVTVDDKGNILKREEKKFPSLSSLEKYEEMSKKSDVLMPNTVRDGGETYTDYSKIRIGLALYRYSSTRFFVASTYEWLEPFDYDYLLEYKAAVGLAVGDGLSMEGSSYAGRVTMTNIRGDIIQKTNGNGLRIQATGAYGIGYSFTQKAQRDGVIKHMQGVISCTAYKTSSAITNCPAYGEYADVSFSLDLDNFSVSIPAGISFNLFTSYTAYSHQDNLDLR